MTFSSIENQINHRMVPASVTWYLIRCIIRPWELLTCLRVKSLAGRLVDRSFTSNVRFFEAKLAGSTTGRQRTYIAAVNKKRRQFDAVVKDKFKREATPPKMSLTRVKTFPVSSTRARARVYHNSSASVVIHTVLCKSLRSPTIMISWRR